jgi:hypothetical protein
VDHQPGTDVLISSKAVSRPAISLSWLVAGLSLLMACPRERQTLPPDLPAVGGQATILRVPRNGGLVEAYDAERFGEAIWTSRVPVGRIKELIGVNLEARLLLAVDTNRTMIAVDLEARGVRPISTGVDQAVRVPNGSVYTLSSKKVVRYDAGTPTAYRAVLPATPEFQFGTYSDRYVAVLGTIPPQMLILSSDRQLRSEEIARGERVATYWGDLLGVATTGEVLLYDTNDPYGVESIPLTGTARHLTFSPSGHRLYVVTEAPAVTVIDRFSKEQLATIPLPGVPERIRTDGTGRWMLARPAKGDSLWIIDLATGRRLASVTAKWGDDLPTVAGRATLLLRSGSDVVASDLSRANLPEIGRIENGARDLWTVTTWVPREHQQQAAAAAESASVAQDSLLGRDTTAAPLATDRLYLQVSSSQNVEWSRELARQLSGAGYPARVLEPTTVDEGYRVVVGPYSTREEAEETGRKLGRPYFILTNPPIGTGR